MGAGWTCYGMQGNRGGKGQGESSGRNEACRSSISALFIGGYTIHKMRLIKIGKGTGDLKLLLSLTRILD